MQGRNVQAGQSRVYGKGGRSINAHGNAFIIRDRAQKRPPAALIKLGVVCDEVQPCNAKRVHIPPGKGQHLCGKAAAAQSGLYI